MIWVFQNNSYLRPYYKTWFTVSHVLKIIIFNFHYSTKLFCGQKIHWQGFVQVSRKKRYDKSNLTTSMLRQTTTLRQFTVAVLRAIPSATYVVMAIKNAQFVLYQQTGTMQMSSNNHQFHDTLSFNPSPTRPWETNYNKLARDLLLTAPYYNLTNKMLPIHPSQVQNSVTAPTHYRLWESRFYTRF